MTEAFIYEAVRTPFGRYGGALAGVRPDNLAAHAIGALLARVPPSLDPAQLDDVLFGQRKRRRRGEPRCRADGRAARRLADRSVPGATINRLCGSSLDAGHPGVPDDPSALTRRCCWSAASSR